MSANCPFLSQLNPLHAPITLHEDQSNIIPTSTLGSSKLPLFIRLPHKIPAYTSPLPNTCYMPCPSSPGSRHMYLSLNKVSFHYELLLAHALNTKLEDHPLSVLRDYLFNIFAATIHTGVRSSIRNLKILHNVVKGTHSLSWAMCLFI